MLQEKLQFPFLSTGLWTKINPQKPKHCGVPEHSLGAGGRREEREGAWWGDAESTHTVLSRNSNCSSPPHFSLALGTSHQLTLHCAMQRCLCCTAEPPVRAKQQCSRQKSLIQQIYISIGLGAYYTENTARGRENMTKQKYWPKYRRWQGWRNPTLCKSMHLKGKPCYSDCPLANCPSGEQKASLWFTKITRITWFLNIF